jgi:WD40 repeat protein
MHRKIYIGDSLGTIRCFNVSSGAIIKKFETKNLDEMKDKSSSAVYSSEICSLQHYICTDNQTNSKRSILISSHCNEQLRAWDVTDDLKTEKLKTVKGGHDNNNVSTMNMSSHLCMIATGSYGGTISLWDLEAFKQIGFLKGHKMPVSGIEFVPNHPLVVTTCLSGITCIHVVRGDQPNHKLMNVCLAKFVNLEGGNKFFNEKTQKEDVSPYRNVGITSCVLHYADLT